ncbi:MAG: GerMN domain-containing protein [Clostridia bacterium]|nr:GerMN domain-containing protein [Clostridia bacterium]
MKRKLIIIIALLAIILMGARLFAGKAQQEEEREIEELSGKIVLYFKGKNEMELGKEYRNVSINSIRENAGKTIVEEVLKGPTSEELVSTIPEETRLLAVSVEGNMAIVDLSREFIEKQQNNAADSLLGIYSIVNSLTELTEIEQVKFLIESREAESYNGYFDMSKPFVRSI